MGMGYYVEKATGHVVGSWQGGEYPKPADDDPNMFVPVDGRSLPFREFFHPGCRHYRYIYDVDSGTFEEKPDPRVRVRYIDEADAPVTKIEAMVGDPEFMVWVETIGAGGNRQPGHMEACQIVAVRGRETIIPITFINGVAGVPVRTDRAGEYRLTACHEIVPEEELVIQIRAARIGD